MSEHDETAVAEPEARKPARKKTAKKAVSKKVSKKTAGAKGKVAKTPRARKEGLRKPQVRVLSVLARAKRPMSRVAIAEKANVDRASLTEVLGSPDKSIREKNDERKGWKSLVSLGYAKLTHEANGTEDRTGVVASITVSGEKALQKLE